MLASKNIISVCTPLWQAGTLDQQSYLNYVRVLTFMSIRDEIRRRTEEIPPRLFFLPPLIEGAAMERELFVSEEINRIAHPPWSETPSGRRFALMRAYLDAWTEGRLISIADDPYHKPKRTFMARIDPSPDEVFDIRVRTPKPGIRVLGCFGDRDLFVSLTQAGHEDLVTDQDWRNEREACKAAWRRLFPTYKPFHGASLNEYLSSNFHVV
jgi:hypothetical protein